MAFEAQIRIVVDLIGTKAVTEFRSVQPFYGGDPYRYHTEEEAKQMLRFCYPELLPKDTRVIEVNEEPNMRR